MIQPGQHWPNVIGVYRSSKNTWHVDLSFARQPTDEEIIELQKHLMGFVPERIDAAMPRANEAQLPPVPIESAG